MIPMNQKMRQRVGRQIGEKRRTGAYWQGWNRPEIPADLRISVNEFHHPRFVPSGKTKGREKMGVCPSYRHGLRMKWVGIY
jgi:hypothetical protein